MGGAQVQNIRERAVKDNKGLTLMEIVVAVALFAIIIVPVMTSFVTSMRVNQKSRKLMIASDLGQAIMEGFADKSYSEIKTQIDSIGTADVSFAPISANGVTGYYNLSTNGKHFTDSNMKNDAFAWNSSLYGDHKVYPTVSGNKFKLSSASSCDCVMLISENSAEYEWARSMNVAFFKATQIKTYASGSVAGGKTSWLYGGTRDDMGFLVYSDVPRGGYHYAVCIQFIPMMKSANVDATHKPLYYTYEVMLYIYELETGAEKASSAPDTPILTMMTGIRN